MTLRGGSKGQHGRMKRGAARPAETGVAWIVDRDVRLPLKDRDERALSDKNLGRKGEMRGMQITPSCNIDEESECKGRVAVEAAQTACCYK